MGFYLSHKSKLTSLFELKSASHIIEEIEKKHQPYDCLESFEKANYKKKLDVWVTHELTQRNLNDRITINEMLLKRNEMKPFLKRIITGDEK